ncbi:hypothetical protein MKD41_02990 [Lutibacter sp. A64]|uniref:ATP-binding protein n=1 Tax=Lutibacter sp. A64 TaxID=2918526 RepID=UPI001F06403B|nr:tetratricopeptide repeat-containing sensor histidine kinase [Lutibacter sp. A64]UMB54451.1 hypothetical protein MKD41_02990 [Lutibacter sp. A64]
MKSLISTCLFFVIFSFSLLVSCTSKEELKSSNNIAVDSIGIFMKKMKNDTLDLKTRLNAANKSLKWVSETKDSSYKKDILAYKIYLFINVRQYDSAVHISKELLHKSIEEKDSTSIGLNYTRIAYYFNRNQQKDSAYYYYNLIKNEYLRYIDSITIGNNFLEMAIIERTYGDYSASDYSGSLALNYYGDKSPNTSASVYNNWAISSKSQGALEDALIFYKKAIDLTTSKQQKILIANNLAVTYREIGDYNSSIKILDSLLKDTITLFRTKARVIDNLAYTKWLAKKEENVLPALEKALEMRLQENDLWGLIASYAHLSAYYKKLSPKISLSYASKLYDVAIRQKSIPDQLDALQKFIELEDSEKAKEYYSTYVHLNDSLQKTKLLAKNQFAKVKYESDKNQKENLQLKIAQEASKLQLEKEKTRNIIGVVSSGAVVLGLLGFLYYRKQKHKQEKRIEVYNTETRIAKKIHDEVANNVVNIMNKVQYTSASKEVLLDDLENVYMLTRNISHQNNIIETGDKFVNSLKSMLSSFNNNRTTVIIKKINEAALELVSNDKQIEIYRVLQELMVNMQKHSEATLVAISFKNDDKNYAINYSDNGKGVDKVDLNLKNGLKNVETRIKSINGIINFETSLNKGFKVFISFKR